LSFWVGNSAGKFPADSENRRKQLPTYEGFSWKPESAGNSAGNVFPADFLPIFAGKSAGNMQIYSSVLINLLVLF
jgi:hypothetical protein